MTEFNQIELQHFVDFHTRVSRMPKKQPNLLRDDALLVLMLVLAVLTLLVGILSLAARFWLQALDSISISIKSLPAFVTWLVQDNQNLIIGGGLILASLFFLSLMRVRVLRKHHLWLVNGCPHCRERDLIRIRRLPNDRLLGVLGLPVRRYACRNCTWQGRLLDVRREPPSSAQPTDVIDTPMLADVMPDVDTLRALEPAAPRRRSAPVSTPVVEPLAPAPPVTERPQPVIAKAAALEAATPVAVTAAVETAVASPPPPASAAEATLVESGEDGRLHEVLYVKAPSYEQASDDAPEFDPDFERLCYEVALNGRS